MVQNIKVYFSNLSLNSGCPQLSMVDITSSNSTHLCYSIDHTSPPVSIVTEVKHQSIVRVDTGHGSTDDPFDVKMSPYQYKNLHNPDKMISSPCYFYNENPCKDSLWIEMGPWIFRPWIGDINIKNMILQIQLWHVYWYRMQSSLVEVITY